ncbi:MAG: hypothetical protein AB7U75_07110 [Hyphomicrobiaceae bacterium]
MCSEAHAAKQIGMSTSKALMTASLPQYLESEDMMARFLDAAHIEDQTVGRTEYVKGLRVVRASEAQLDAMNFFIDRQSECEAEFLTRLTSAIGQQKAMAFCSVLAEDWLDGRAKRQDSAVQQLRASVEGYLLGRQGRPTRFDVSSQLLTPQDCARILELNQSMLSVAIDDWIERHPRSCSMASDEVFFRRGLVLAEPFRDMRVYKERDVISSYSLSITVAEQFCNSEKPTPAALINADIGYFKDRILFFSPFIPGMDGRQLEAGIIPGDEPDIMSFHGIHRGIAEYLLGYPTELLVTDH